MDDWNQETTENKENRDDFGFPESEPIVISEAEAQEAVPQNVTVKTSKKGTVFAVVIIALLLIAAGAVGIRTLALRRSVEEQDAERAIKLEKGTWTKFQAYYATPEAVEFKHTVNFIPTAKEHYYLVFSVDFSEFVLVRADKSWYDDNFTDWCANDETNGVTVEGFVRKTNSDVVREAAKAKQTLVSGVGKSFRADTSLYIDLLAVRLSIYEILIMAIPLLVGLIALIGSKLLADRLDSTAVKVVCVFLFVGFLVYGGFVIHVISML